MKYNNNVTNSLKSYFYTSKLLGLLSKYIKPGINGLFLNEIANKFIYENKLIPAFLNFNNYPYSICVSINNEIIHGIPNKKKFKNGDIVTIDCGVLYNNYYSDSAYTFPVGNIMKKNKQLLKVTKNSLYYAINKFKNSHLINDIGNSIYKYITNRKFNVVTNYCGHGIGKKLHMDPLIYNSKVINNIKIKPNTIISIEPIATVGKPNNYISNNKWTVKTLDKSFSAHYEHNILVLNKGCKILTTFKYIK
ncbi:MAG: type I methionyl aminopeptidase [Candidatus Shikimatogenerans sp. AspAUS03]|uniref:Methionine aminopeptidase n=1 Tax=Candidatus Shikimatogenerans sp. AspAUS03 TaxID=3158563 RepID=A0AAU7QSH8_9FLAO